MKKFLIRLWKWNYGKLRIETIRLDYTREKEEKKMKLASPKPFTFEGGDRAVLLLHGFTGNSADVRMLGRYLEKKATLATPRFIKVMVCLQNSLFIQVPKTGGKT